jgi:hypothetical protein
MTCQIIHHDLAKLSTIKHIADYMVSVQKKHSEDWAEEIESRRVARIEEEAATAEDDKAAAAETAAPTSPPLIDIVGSYIIFDGQPATNYDRLFASHAQVPNRNPFSRVHCFFGGFHTIMKLHNAMGKLFDYIFKIFYASYRRTTARILYIQFPGDPRQLKIKR